MKKALHRKNEVFFYQARGEVHVWKHFPEEIVECANKWLSDQSEGFESTGEELVYKHLSEWMGRYLEEGVHEGLLDDLNNAISGITYEKKIIPGDAIDLDTENPINAYLAQLDGIPPEALAADDFSKLLTSGELERLKRCNLSRCEKFFLGRPQAKWCSKTCGSKYRVGKKRKRDSIL